MPKSPGLVLIMIAVVVAIIVVSACAPPTPILIYNASASVPLGFYRVVSGAPKRGDFVLVRTPDSVRVLAAQRGYLPIGVPLVKHLAAAVGDEVCTSKKVVIINGAVVARQHKTDSRGRPLPRWNDCRKLKQDEYFLLADAPDSFDSRYFGPMMRTDLIGRLVPLWVE